MKIKDINSTKKFSKQFEKLPKMTQEKTLDKLSLLLKDPFYPSLRLHSLRGKFLGIRSISIDMKYRVLFTFPKEGKVLLISIGNHSIYEK